MVDFAGMRRFVIVLGCLTGIGAVGIDMSLPSIPDMVRDLATTMATGQQIVGVFVAGVALGQLPAGLVSDRVGRMPVILAGIRISTVINMGTATLGATIGAGGLGKPIIAGLIGENPAFILEGAILVGLFAIIVDTALGMIGREEAEV